MPASLNQASTALTNVPPWRSVIAKDEATRRQLGAIAGSANLVKDEVFSASAQALVQQVSESDVERGLIYPPLTEIREVCAAIAAAVAEVAYQRGLATQPKPADLQAYHRGTDVRAPLQE